LRWKALRIYSESFDVEKLRKEIKEDSKKRVNVGFDASSVLWSAEVFAVSLLVSLGVC
jgi:hypothetical protein